MNDRSPLLGFLLAALSSLLGGTAVATTRLLVGGLEPPVEPLVVVSLRYAIGAAVLLLLSWRSVLLLCRRSGLLPVAGLGLWFYALFPFLFTLSLANTSAARGALALSTMPQLTMGLAVATGIEVFRWARLAGIALALTGVALALVQSLNTSAPNGAWIGDLVMVATAAVGAGYNVVSRPYLRQHPSLAVTTFGMTLGALVLAAATTATTGWSGLAAAPAGFWLALAYLGTMGCAAPFWLWSAALERTQPTSVAVTVALNPISAMLIGALVLEEQVAPALLAGLATVLAGIVLANWRQSS